MTGLKRTSPIPIRIFLRTKIDLVPAAQTIKLPDNPNVRLLAISVADENPELNAAQPRDRFIDMVSDDRLKLSAYLSEHAAGEAGFVWRVSACSRTLRGVKQTSFVAS